jgi:hypothetical protein
MNILLEVRSIKALKQRISTFEVKLNSADTSKSGP